MREREKRGGEGATGDLRAAAYLLWKSSATADPRHRSARRERRRRPAAGSAADYLL